MTKQELVMEVAHRCELSMQDARKAVDAFLATLTETLEAGGEVSFTGFGKFQTQLRAARGGVNPQNPSQKIEIPAARVPKFSPGSGLKKAVKSG